MFRTAYAARAIGALLSFATSLNVPITVVTHRNKANPFRRSSILFRPQIGQTSLCDGGDAGYRPRVRSAYYERVYVHSPEGLLTDKGARWGIQHLVVARPALYAGRRTGRFWACIRFLKRYELTEIGMGQRIGLAFALGGTLFAGAAGAQDYSFTIEQINEAAACTSANGMVGEQWELCSCAPDAMRGSVWGTGA